jgi:hypothetical protein
MNLLVKKKAFRALLWAGFLIGMLIWHCKEKGVQGCEVCFY